MSNDHAAPSAPSASASGSAPANPAGAWLGSQSVFDTRDDRKIGRAFSASVALHSAMLAVLFLAFAVAPSTLTQPPPTYDIVFLPEPGPGGGGGGSPAPAPPKKLEVPKHAEPPPPTPIPDPVTPPPTPVLTAPVETNMASVLQAAGTSMTSLADYAGGGRGRGIGPGRGDGIGPGTGGGFGDGAYGPGAGISDPVPILIEKPKYTSEAMRAKIQGVAQVEAVVLENGMVGEVRIHRSLDKVFGLDLEALAAARKWRFRPATNKGVPVKFRVLIELEFRLH